MPDMAASQQGRSGEFATVRDAGRHGMITLRCDLSSKSLNDTVHNLTGMEVPGQGDARFMEEWGILWMSPDELLVFCPPDEAVAATVELEAALEATHALVADVSDARTVFAVSGAGSREVLAKLTPADIAPDRLRPGMVRRSRLAQVPAAFWLAAENSFRVICFRSVAGYVFDLLSTAATSGSEVRYF